MEKYIIEIDHCEKLRVLDKLTTLVDSFRFNLGKYHVLRGTEKEVLGKLNDIISDKESKCEEEYNKVVNFFRDKLNKYWRMQITRFSDGIEYVEKKLIYPYSIVDGNGYVACVQSSDVSDGYKYTFVMEDHGFTVEQLCNSNGKTIVQLEEISRDEFFTMSNNAMNQVLDGRLLKIAERGKGI